MTTPASTAVSKPAPRSRANGGQEPSSTRWSGPAWSGGFDREDGTVDPDRTFLSYRHACDPGSDAPDADVYAELEPYFDAELRAITAHVLLPVGAGPTRHVLATYTARSAEDVDLDALHGTELRGSGWLVVPIVDPGSWTEADPEQLVAGLRELQRTDFRRESDLGRFLAGNDPYLVR